MLLAVFAVVFYVSVDDNSSINPAKEQWYLNDNPEREVNIGWPCMWETYSKIDNSRKCIVKVAVIDSGIDSNHPEIKDSIRQISGSCKDKIGHGTTIAGIICASQYHVTVVGISDSKRTIIIPIKVTGQNGKEESLCSVEQLIEAIKIAESEGCDICNISLNTDKDDPELEKVIAESNMLFVVSAGNGDPKGRNLDDDPSYPASYEYENLITVTSVTANGRIQSIANYGSCIDIGAPGTEIYNISIDNDYSVNNGTSFATPIVTGLAAMLYICDRNMTPRSCKEIILETAKEERRLKGKAGNNKLIQLDAAIACKR